MSWLDNLLAAFDLETTAADPLTARIVTGALIRIDGAEKRTRTWLLDPGVDIPEEATAVHGISTEAARAQGQNYEEGYREIRDDIEQAWAEGRVVVIFNAAYDLTVIDTEGRRLGYLPLDVGPVADPFVLDRKVDYRPGKRTLGVTATQYGIALGSNAHAADADALAAARLVWKLAKRYPYTIGQLDAEQLMVAQAEWHRARQADYAAYLRRTGEDASEVSEEWPIRKPRT